jgi:hypothetical protein
MLMKVGKRESPKERSLLYAGRKKMKPVSYGRDTASTATRL